MPVLIGEPYCPMTKEVLAYLSENTSLSSKVVSVRQLSGGITNCIYKVSLNGDSDVLVRFHGTNTSTIINRQLEVLFRTYLHSHNLASPVLFHDDKGDVTVYINGSSLEPEQVHIYYPEITDTISTLHSLPIPSSLTSEATVFTQLNSWINSLLSIESLHPHYQTVLNSRDILSVCRERISSLASGLSISNCICHNDLLSGNFILNDERDKVNLIDFEYTNINSPAYEIANFL
ncbi:hypothetical protein GEMRC1_008899 [Eukaryota sp. GEM-RC1]